MNGQTERNSCLDLQLHNDAPTPKVVPRHPHTRYLVVGQSGVWFIRFDGEKYGPYLTEREAMLFAIDAAYKLGVTGKGVDVLLIDENGNALRTWTHGQEPVFIRAISPSLEEHGNVMQITRHDKSYIVELADGSEWRTWPRDIATTLRWSPTTELQVLTIEHEFCSHALIDRADGSRMSVIKSDATSSVGYEASANTRVPP